MRALVIDFDGFPSLSGGVGKASLDVLAQLVEDAPADVRVAMRLPATESFTVRDTFGSSASRQVGLLKAGPKSDALDDYLYVYGPDDCLILTSGEGFEELEDRVLYMDRNVGLNDPFVQGCVRAWLAGTGLAGDFEAAMEVLGSELVRIVAGTGMPPEGWLENWMSASHPALRGACPLDFMTTLPRRLVVVRLLMALESGAYQ